MAGKKIQRQAAATSEELEISNDELESIDSQLRDRVEDLDETEIRMLNAELEQRVAAGEHQLRAILDAAVDAIVTIDKDGIIRTVNKAAETMFGYRTDEIIGREVTMLMGAPYREQHDDYLRRYAKTGERRVIGKVRELRARRKNGAEFPIQLSVSEIPDPGLYTGIIRDMTENRDLQERMMHAATVEQRRLGQELHDTTLQDLAGLGLLAQHMVETLNAPDDSPQRKLATKITAGISEVNSQIRRLANGLVPVPVDAEGLMAALAKLAQRTEDDSEVACSFVCPDPVPITDDTMALHLYRIGQEAVTNAVRHSKADTISILLGRRNGSLRLEIRDNGVGIAADASEQGGLGLRIMEHRCMLMGGKFSARPHGSGGTVIRCEVPMPREC